MARTPKRPPRGQTRARGAPPSPPAAREQRRHQRLDVKVRAWLVDPQHTVYLRLHDLSRGGLSVRAPVPFAPATAVDVGLELPDGARVRARGEIVWVRSSDDDTLARGPYMGARFLELYEGERELNALLDAAT